MDVIKYDVSMTPSTPEVQLGISMTPNGITIQVEEMGDCSIAVTPSPGTIVAGALAGALAGVFGSAVGVATVYAAGAVIKDALENTVKNSFTGQSISKNFDPAPGYKHQIKGVNVNVEAETFSLSTYNGMLMVTGTVKVS